MNDSKPKNVTNPICHPVSPTWPALFHHDVSKDSLSNSVTTSDTLPISEVITGGGSLLIYHSSHEARVERMMEFMWALHCSIQYNCEVKKKNSCQPDSRPSGGDADICQRVERSEAGHQVVQPREGDQVHGNLIQIHVERSLKTSWAATQET